jgi:hypothetical protein
MITDTVTVRAGIITVTTNMADGALIPIVRRLDAAIPIIITTTAATTLAIPIITVAPEANTKVARR